MLCRFCGKDRKLIKAHIVPEGFFKIFPQDAGVTRLYSNAPGTYPKRAPVGIYDRTILCQECDNRFSPWDQHAQDVLLRGFSEDSVIRHESQTVGWLIRDFDYGRLKLFFLALLWRASVSNERFFRRIEIGPFERTLKQMIEQGDPGSPESFAVMLARFDSEPYALAIMDPHPERYEGINYCRFYLGGFVAYIKVDGRSSPSTFVGLAIREDAPIVVVARSAREGKDAEIMRDIARRAWRFHHGA